MTAKILPDQVRRRLPGPRARRLPLGIARGIRMQVDMSGGQIRLFLGQYETELNRHLRRVCQAGGDAFDLGGQNAYDALVLAKLTGARVVTVDSERTACQGMRDNIALNPDLADRIHVVHATVGALHDLPDGKVSIDGLAAGTFRPAIVKLDIEGAEVMALRGAEEVLARDRPAWVVEVHGADLERDCARILDRHHYRVTVVDQRRFLADHRLLPHNRWLVALPK